MQDSKTEVQILKGIVSKQYFPDAKHIIIYAFSIGERHYFRFDDPLNTPYDRALKCLVYYRELDMNCDKELLTAHTHAFDTVLSRSKLSISDLVELKKLNDQLKQRLELPKEPELMYKLASVVFFDQFENPYIYEFGYGEKKIKAWKKNTTLTDFFFEQAIEGINSLFAICRRKFTSVFPNDRKSITGSFGQPISVVIGRTEDDIDQQKKIINGAVNSAILPFLTIYEFYFELEQILKAAIKQKATRK